MNRGVFCTLMAVQCSVGAAFGEGLKAQSFSETFLQNVPVSATVITGLARFTSQTLLDNSLWVRPGGRQMGQICISITSDDGIYHSEAVFPLDGGLVGDVRLDFPTRYLRELRSLGAPRIGVLARIQDSCAVTKDGVPLYIPIAWSARDAQLPIHLFVNGGNTFVQLYDTLTQTFTDCSRLALDAPNVAFDAECVVSPSLAHGAWTGYVLRTRIDISLPRIPFQVAPGE